MAAVNARDVERFAATFNYPTVRIASGAISVIQDAEQGRSRWDFSRIDPEWHHTLWDERRVIQRSEAKAHVAVRFTRYRADGSSIATYESLYIMSREEGHWGIQGRSSFAP
ncbi:MAG: hypothetical protein JRH19_03445 [Deltaproteobacteria bacterium]|nr:hypothetical protein [Deltaproteobacteria bacterium]